jgi:hypothetical protein
MESNHTADTGISLSSTENKTINGNEEVVVIKKNVNVEKIGKFLK